MVYRLWASVRLAHPKDWFYSWVPDSVFSAGKGVSSVDAWYATSIDIEEVLSHARHSDFHIWRSPTRASMIPENACAWWCSSWWPPCRRRALTGAGLVALGRLLFVNGFGDCMWCHDEAHRTQHHHSHEERFSRLRRTLTTSRVFSLSDVHCGAALITAT